jgi:sulfide:quinone oxidoreductase
MQAEQTKILIAGGGVAALETLLGLRELAEERVSIELLAPRPEFTYRPLAVAEPFGLGEAKSYDLERITRECGASLRVAKVTAVEPARHRVLTARDAIDYDLLVVAIGAEPRASLPGAVMMQGPGYTSRFRTILRKLETRKLRRLTFAVPIGASWPLPLYELALMTAARVAERNLRKVELRLVTPERVPLELFGGEASAAVSELLEERGIELLTDLYPSSVEEGALAVVPCENAPVPADEVVTLPRLVGPGLAGLPHDPDGFIPTDLHGVVHDEGDVYAAGDATVSPIKQGGIASQQADAVAEAIAARVGAALTPTPFRPVLRGLLLTGTAPRYMRAEIAGGRGEGWDVSEHALWWPPAKIAGRYLSPFLALRHDDLELRGREGAIAVDLDLAAKSPAKGTVSRRAIISAEPSRHLIALPPQTRYW